MKNVRIKNIKVGDVICFYGRFYHVESVSSMCDVCGTRYIVKTHDCDDIFHIRFFTDCRRIYKVISD